MSIPSTTLAAVTLDCEGRFRPSTLGPDVLADLYREIGCRTVEVVQLTDELTMWLDEEGAEIEPVNNQATAIARQFGFIYQPYFGVAVFTGGVDVDGNTLRLTPVQTTWLLGQAM